MAMDRRNFLNMLKAFGVTTLMPTSYLLKSASAFAQAENKKAHFVINLSGGLNLHHVVNIPAGCPDEVTGNMATIPGGTGTYRNASTQMSDFFTAHGARTMSVFYSTGSLAHGNSRNSTHTNTENGAADSIWAEFVKQFGPTKPMATFVAGDNGGGPAANGAVARTNVDANTGQRIANILSPQGIDLNTALAVIEAGDASKAGFSSELLEQVKASVDDQRKLISAASELSGSTDPVDLWATAVQLGMSSLCVYTINGCDTHSNSDNAMFNGANARANRAFTIANNVITQATAKGFGDDLTITFTGDFCRTLTFNGSNGTQHNSESQSLIYAGANYNLRYPGGQFGAYASNVTDTGQMGGNIAPTAQQLHEGHKQLWGMQNDGSAKYGM